MATWCCTSATRDALTVASRTEHEGISFLTITLPDFGKGFQKSLDLGHVDRNLFTSFRFRAGLPLFLGGFLDLVFDRGSGVLLENPSVDAIKAIRQLTLLFSKINIACSEKRVMRAMDRFCECEKELKGAYNGKTDLSDFHRVGSLLFRRAFTIVDRKIYDGEVIPKHGPGSTADKLSGNGKYRQTTWPARLEEQFPFGENCLPNWSYYDQLESVEFLEPGQEYPVKVIPVPKTLKTPRIIAIEPTAMQYMQQGVAEILVESFGRFDTLSNFLGFTDQDVNQHLAMVGSRDGTLATLDLSEASDRVSNQHVRLLVKNHKHLFNALDSTRSRKADVLGHGVVRLTKFASMGSALCFPIEACVFLTLVFLGIERELNTPLTDKIVRDFIGSVRVYGDDIVVPTGYVRSVCRVLSDFGHVVNSDKSFWTGRFRESCGKEYYDGHDVSIVKVRHLIPTSRKDATGCVSLVSLRNLFYEHGMWQTCRYLDRKIGKILKYFPVILPTSPVLGRHSFLGYKAERTGLHLQNPVVTGYVVVAQPPYNPLEGSGALLKCFLKRGDMPFADRRHLERSGRPHAVNIKLRRRASAI